jgi:hypothetical protein
LKPLRLVAHVLFLLELSCLSSSIVKNLKENYDNYYDNKDGGDSSIVTIKFSDHQIASLDSILNLQKEAIESTIMKNNDTSLLVISDFSGTVTMKKRLTS